MKKKHRFSCKFIIDFFTGNNVITRKSDGHWWRVDLSFWNLHEDKKAFKVLGDESLAQFFDKNNNFKSDEYELSYCDFFKEYCVNELKQNAAKWIEDLAETDTDKSEYYLKKLFG